MIEADIESAVKAKIAAALPEALAVKVHGAWQTVAEGEVKGRESPEFGAFVGIAVSPRQYESFTIPIADIAVAVSLAVRADRDPTGAAFLAFSDALTLLFETWNRSDDAVAADMSVDGFRADGIRIDGGEVGRDAESAAWTFTQSFTLRGVISPTGLPSTSNT